MSDTKLRNFIAQYRRPYSLAEAASLTGIDIRDLVSLHNTLISENLTREVEPGIYISVAAHYSSVRAADATRIWKYDETHAVQILHELRKRPARSYRDLARRIRRSPEFAGKYISALVAIGQVKITKHGYVASATTELSMLGTNIIPGHVLEKRNKIMGPPNAKRHIQS